MKLPFIKTKEIDAESALVEAARQIADLKETVAADGQHENRLTERLAALELALEDIGWIRMVGEGEQEFSRAGLGFMTKVCRLMALKNPLIQRAIAVQSYYVWGQGVNIRGAHPDVDNVIQDLIAERRNRDELFCSQGQEYKERELSTTGNIFFALFVNPSTGRVRVRTVPLEEVPEIINNPQDSREPWYYKRQWQEQGFDPMQSGFSSSSTKVAYYPDWRYQPLGGYPDRINGAPVVSDCYMMHMKDGGFANWNFGVPFIYSSIDWAKATTEYLQDWASIVRALKRFAWVYKTKGGKAGVQAVKDKFQSTLTVDQIEKNPPPVSGSMAIMGDGKDLQPVKTQGATASPEDVRRLQLMVCAGTGLPETFFGGVQEGSLATATSLDRPTELKFRMRQSQWAETIRNICDFAVEQAIIAPNGPLQGEIIVNEYGEQEIILPDDPDTGDEISRHVQISWPPILEHDMGEVVSAAVNAATLGGHPAVGIMDKRTLSTTILQALGVSDANEIVNRMFPEDEGDQLAISPATTAPPASDAQMEEALRDLRGAVENLIHETA